MNEKKKQERPAVRLPQSLISFPGNALARVVNFFKSCSLTNFRIFFYHLKNRDFATLGDIIKRRLSIVNIGNDYASKIEVELKTHDDKVIVHDLPDIYHYWSNKFLKPKFDALGIENIQSLFADPIERFYQQHNRTVTVASLGPGNCDFEVNIARQLTENGTKLFEIHCYELNEKMIDRGRELAQKEGVAKHFKFIQSDANKIEFKQGYDVFMANQSLHHFTELEHIFEAIRSKMKPESCFVVSDMIGRNGHMLWPEAYTLVRKIWPLLAKEKTWNHQLKRHEKKYDNWDCAKGGFEGIRAQDILPLLIKYFEFDLFYAFANIIDPFIGRNFGPNFDRNDTFDRTFVDFVASLDESYIKEGRITPTHLVARMVLEKKGRTQTIDGLTPEKCVRYPDA